MSKRRTIIRQRADRAAAPPAGVGDAIAAPVVTIPAG